MSPTPTHDPVSAMAEADATGLTAALFAEVREAMAIPLVTSIWRVLAGVDGALESTWGLTRPIVRSGQVDASRARLRDEVRWPRPHEPVPDDLGVDVPSIRSVVAAYTRANTMSLLALSALVSEPVDDPTHLPVPPRPEPWPDLPPLLGRDRIEPETWVLIERVNQIGATPDQPGVATLWRHLASWPGMLTAISAALGPLEDDRSYAEALARTQGVVRAEAARLAHLRPADPPLPESARAVVEPYVTHPGLLQRMVVIGHILGSWLDEEAPR